MQVFVEEDVDRLCHRLAGDLVELINKKVSVGERFSLALSGGNTPKLLFRDLVECYFDVIDWSQVDFFWVDERFVAYESEDSNFGNAERLLLRYIKHGDLFPIGVESDIFTEVREYEAALLEYFGERGISFDCVLLGMGEDGHYASLFDMETIRRSGLSYVTCCYPAGANYHRITLTDIAVSRAKNIWLIAAGTSKGGALSKLNGSDGAEMAISRLPLLTVLYVDQDCSVAMRGASTAPLSVDS